MSFWQFLERPMHSATKALFCWSLGLLLLLSLDPHLDLANLALILVLVAAVSAVWQSPRFSLLTSAVAVLVFSFLFVPPRRAFNVDLRQHLFLLATLLSVSWGIALLMSRQRSLAATAQRHAREALQLRAFGETLREVDTIPDLAHALQQVLVGLGGSTVTLLYVDPDGCEHLQGSANRDEAGGLRLCARQRQAMGPGTSCYEGQPAWYLPLRGRKADLGAVLVRLAAPVLAAPHLRLQAQALVDQLGLALERSLARQGAMQARSRAEVQEARNAMLAAIAHDHRTPLATILGAASALRDQDARLDAPQRLRLLATIVDEAEQLVRLTDNTLQLARLDATDLQLHMDWESAEELVGSVLSRLRRRTPDLKLNAEVGHSLPLIWCNAVLLVQLVENLVENALKYGGDPNQVVIRVASAGDQLLIAVCDRGPGVPVAASEAIFAPYQRGDQQAEGKGAGLGLAVCRAIARAHGASLSLRARRGGGSAFELRFPIAPAPDAELEC